MPCGRPASQIACHTAVPKSAGTLTSKPSSPVKLTRKSRIGTPQMLPVAMLMCGMACAEMSTSTSPASTAEPARCFGDLKTCPAIGNDQVALESDTYTQSHHDPVYGCNDRLRLRQSSEKIGRVSIRLLWTAKSIEFRSGSDLSFANVGPARKTGP